MVLVLYDTDEDVVAVKILDDGGNIKELYVHRSYNPNMMYQEVEAEGSPTGLKEFIELLVKDGSLTLMRIPKVVG